MENREHGGTYFAAMNTADGFKSFFPQIFGSLSRLFIIKGGPGTGKSRLMREFSAKAREKGFVTEEFLCSSDPTSLDGIIIPELSFGMIDGTAPHTYDPSIPGAKERIVDLGQFWDAGALRNNIGEIGEINLRKSRLYRSVYSYLSAVRCYDKTVSEMVEQAIDSEKLDAAVKRAAYSIGNGRSSSHKLRIRSSVSADGFITLNTYAEKASVRYSVLDVCGSAGIFMEKLLRETDIRGDRAIVSYSPFYPEKPDAIFYPEKDIVYYIGSEADYEEKTINMRRFINDRALRPYKPRIRAVSRLRSAALSELGTDYSSVRRLHAEVEKIYSGAMDFSAKEKFSQELIKSVLG